MMCCQDIRECKSAPCVLTTRRGGHARGRDGRDHGHAGGHPRRRQRQPSPPRCPCASRPPPAPPCGGRLPPPCDAWPPAPPQPCARPPGSAAGRPQRPGPRQHRRRGHCQRRFRTPARCRCRRLRCPSRWAQGPPRTLGWAPAGGPR
eukprot:26901_4